MKHHKTECLFLFISWVMSRWLQDHTSVVPPLCLELQLIFSHPHINKYSPEVMTATNQYYVVLRLVVMGNSVIFRAFRK